MAERQRTASHAMTGELVEFFTEHLRLCQVQPDEHVVIHSDSGTYPSYPAAFLGAARILGADVFQIVHPHGPNRAVVEAWKRADLLIDLTSRPHAYGEAIRDTLLAGTRIMRVLDTEDTLRRLAPTPQLRERVEAGAEIMEKGKVMHITSEAGTDLTLYKEGRMADGIYSVADKPGRWDIWPSGLICCAPEEDKGHGVFVLDKGDVMLRFHQYVREPVYMEISDGCITKISGGYEAEMLRDWFAQFKDPNAYRVAHVGWGCDERADWYKPGQDNEAFYGNMQLAFGANLGHFLQGTTASRAHHDFPCRAHSYWIDEEQIMDAGEFVIDTLKCTVEDALDAVGELVPD